MSTTDDRRWCDQADNVTAWLLRTPPASEAPVLEQHLSQCAVCRGELEKLRLVFDSVITWGDDVLRPSPSLRDRLGDIVGNGDAPALPPPGDWLEPEWENVAPGISCKMLATDSERHRVSMLVRLEPGGEYPPHKHAGVEELHLLHGELWINERKLYPGDFNRAEPDTADTRVWSETGCTCVLITSTRDMLG